MYEPRHRRLRGGARSAPSFEVHLQLGQRQEHLALAVDGEPDGGGRSFVAEQPVDTAPVGSCDRTEEAGGGELRERERCGRGVSAAGGRAGGAFGRAGRRTCIRTACCLIWPERYGSEERRRASWSKACASHTASENASKGFLVNASTRCSHRSAMESSCTSSIKTLRTPQSPPGSRRASTFCTCRPNWPAIHSEAWTSRRTTCGLPLAAPSSTASP